MAALGYIEGFPKQGGGVEFLQLVESTQVALAIGKAPLPQLHNRTVVMNGGQCVLQWLALAAVHMHIAAGDHGQLPHGGEVAVVVIVVGILAAE